MVEESRSSSDGRKCMALTPALLHIAKGGPSCALMIGVCCGEHLVLDTLLTLFPRIRYWRDKREREVDFVLPVSDRCVDIVEAKWNADAFEPKNLRAFRSLYPEGRNIVISHQAQPAFTRDCGGLSVIYSGLPDLRALLKPGKSN